MSLIVDASVAVKWFAEEPGSIEAEALLASTDELVAPDFILAEIGNALWKKASRGLLDPRQAAASASNAAGYFDRLIALKELTIRSMEIALAVRHPIYDCYYIALAQRENAPLITADERQLAAARKAKVKVRRL
jgi:predicted nucleic acid-binding protein